MYTQFNRRLWISFGIILGSVVIASGVLYYIADALSASAKAIVAGQAVIKQQTSAVATLAELKQAEAEALPYQNAMDQLLPTQDGLIGFSAWLQAIGNADQVMVTATFNPNSAPDSLPSSFIIPIPSLATMGFSLQAQGSAAAIAAFLQDVQSKPGFFVQFTSLDIVSNNSSDMLNAEGNLFFST